MELSNSRSLMTQCLATPVLYVRCSNPRTRQLLIHKQTLQHIMLDTVRNIEREFNEQLNITIDQYISEVRPIHKSPFVNPPRVFWEERGDGWELYPDLLPHLEQVRSK